MARPVIGITVHARTRRADTSAFVVEAAYARAVHAAGGLPVVLPALTDAAAEWLDWVQGIVVTGGGRLPRGFLAIHPAPTLESINPPRYAFERALIAAAVERDLPVLGICRGMQMISETLGGGLVSNIAGDVPDAVPHCQRLPGWRPTHDIALDPGSRVGEIVGATRVPVNSFHRQAVSSPGAGLRVTARATDGVVEAIEGPTRRFLIGVQFHPERLRDDRWLRLFRALVEAAQARQ